MPNLVSMLIGLERSLAGLKRKSVQIGDHRIVYSEGGKGSEALVLVHGFNSSADSWNRLAGRLGKHYHIIAPDLPGWGESTRMENGSYGYPEQVERLHQFLQLMGLKRFYLMGHSMGGCISSTYAATFSGEVIALGLIAPHGVTEPTPSELFQSVARGDNWLAPSTLPGFTRLLDNCFGKRPYIPGPVLKALAAQTIQRSEKSGKIFTELQVKMTPVLEDRLKEITAPTLIIWGDEDKVLHVSAAEVFRRGIKDSQALILHSGHMPLMENAGKCAETWLEFIKKPRHAAEAAA